MPVKITYEVKDEDIFALVKDNFFFSPFGINLRRFLHAFSILVCLILLSYFDHSSIRSILINIAITIFIAMIFSPYWKFLLMRKAKKGNTRRNLEKLKKKFVFIFQADSDSFRMNTETNAEDKIIWKSIVRIHQDENHSFLYLEET